MIAAGIDGSTKNTGISIMEDGKLLFHTLIDYHKEKDTAKRIRMMQLGIVEILKQYKINAVYMEKAFNKGNIDTTIKLSQLSGGVIFYCAQNDIEFVNPLPSQWRKVVGLEQSSKVKRDVLKAEAVAAVKKEYNLDLGDDEAEAILLARSAFDLPKIGMTEDELWESV